MRGRWEESEEWLSSGLHLKGPNKALTYLGMSGPHRRGYAAFLQNAPIHCGLEGVYEVPIADVERLLQVAITVKDEFHVGLKDICGA